MMSDDEDEKVSTTSSTLKEAPSESEKMLINALRINSPSDFLASFGKLEDFSKFGEYLNRLNDMCRKKWPVCKSSTSRGEELKVGDRIMIRSPSYGGDQGQENDDIEWRRGLIQSIDRRQETASVYLVDEGFVWDKQPFDCMIRFEHELNVLDSGVPLVWMDPVAKLCRLRNACPAAAGWSLDATDYFARLVDGPQVFVTGFTQLPNDTHHVFEHIYDVDISVKGVSLLNSMISAGFASMNRPKFIGNSMNGKANSTDAEDDIMECKVVKPSSSQLSSSKNNHHQKQQHHQQQHKSNLSTSVFDENAQDDEDEYEEICELSSDEDDDADDAFRVVYVKDKSLLAKNKSRSTTGKKNAKNNKNSDEKICDNNPMKRDNSSVMMMSSGESSSYSMTSQTAVMTSKKPSSTNNRQHHHRKANNNDDDVCEIDLEDELPPEVYISRLDPNDKRPVLKPTSFIASDETILTGYRPNVVIDRKKLADDIRVTRMEKYKLKVVSDPTPASISPIPQDKAIVLEKKVYEILTGTSGFYDSTTSKTKALAGLYRTKPSRHVENLIIKCVLKEVKSDNLDYKVAFEILKGLEFCDNLTFLASLKEVVDEQRERNNDPDQAHLNDETRQDMCRLLANLYLFANETNSLKFLDNVSKYCVDLIEDWIGIYINRDIPNHVYLSNFKNVHDFLDVCLYAFKKYSQRAMNYVYTKVDFYSQDSTLTPAIKSESIRILSLIASKFLGQDPTHKTRRTSNGEIALNSSDSPVASSSLESASSASTAEKPRSKVQNNPRHFNYYSRSYCTKDMDLAFSKFLEQNQRGDQRESVKRKNF